MAMQDVRRRGIVALAKHGSPQRLLFRRVLHRRGKNVYQKCQLRACVWHLVMWRLQCVHASREAPKTLESANTGSTAQH